MSQDVDLWIKELNEAGWKRHATNPTMWISPLGGWYRGPYKAWCEMRGITVVAYRKVAQEKPNTDGTQLWMICCDEGWRESIVCGGMYEWAADWLIEQIQGKPYAPGKH